MEVTLTLSSGSDTAPLALPWAAICGYLVDKYGAEAHLYDLEVTATEAVAATVPLQPLLVTTSLTLEQEAVGMLPERFAALGTGAISELVVTFRPSPA